MGKYNMQQIKRDAHKEAWKPDSFNPFRKFNTGLSRYSKPRDLEDGGPARRIQSEPGPTSGGGHFGSIDETGAQSSGGLGVGGSDNTHSSEKTAVNGVEKGKSNKPPSIEQQARHRFLDRFHRKGKNPNPLSIENREGFTGGSSDAGVEGDGSKDKKKFTLKSQIMATVFNSWINILILAAPVGIALSYVGGVNEWAVFAVNFVAIIPLAAMLSYATEELALRVGETLGGLLNATFGNAVELIVSILALLKHEYVIVKTSLIGSMLSNLLLVMGMCFFFGGLRRDEQFFNVTVAQTAASLLALAIASNIIPTAFDISVTTSNDAALSAKISRGTSIILLFVYGSYLFFQLKTHNAMYMQESQKVPMRPKKHQPLKEGALKMGLAQAGGVSLAAGRFRPSTDGDGRPQDEIMDRPPNTANSGEEDDDDEPEEPQLTLLVALITLAASTVIIAFCAEAMVSSINGITGSVSAEFVGLILLPIVGNAAEHATAVTVAVKDKMDLAIGVAVGSSMQIALFVLPFIVVVGWGLDLDQMNLSFDGFQIAVLFVSVLLVNYLIGDGKSHWLEGALLMSLYLIIAVTAWFYPNGQPGSEGVAGA